MKLNELTRSLDVWTSNEEQEVLFAATHGRPIEKIFVVPGDLWMTQEK